MKLASLDIEISNELSSPGDENWPPKIACAAVALSDYPDEVKFFTSSRESDAMDLSQIHDLIANLYNLKDAGYTFLCPSSGGHLLFKRLFRLLVRRTHENIRHC